jgi:N-acetylglucosamine kinase-like BadF-type ATPase
MTVRPFAGAKTTLFVATIANGRIVLQGGNGTATVTVDATTTATFTPGRYVYDFVFDSGQTVTTVLDGQFIVTPGVSV